MSGVRRISDSLHMAQSVSRARRGKVRGDGSAGPSPRIHRAAPYIRGRLDLIISYEGRRAARWPRSRLGAYRRGREGSKPSSSSAMRRRALPSILAGAVGRIVDHSSTATSPGLPRGGPDLLELVIPQQKASKVCGQELVPACPSGAFLADCDIEARFRIPL